MMVLGIDLSGPSNTADTSVAVFTEDHDRLVLKQTIEGATDEEIYRLVSHLPFDNNLTIGLDAPLSYNPGGGDRPSDKALRQVCIAQGMHPGSVMTPTNTRMAYLTLRGISVARMLASVGHPRMRMVEVHPGAAMVLRGAPLSEVKSLKRELQARLRLLMWLAGEGLQGVADCDNPSDHTVAACACALAAWQWSNRKVAWLAVASPPHHPYDFAC